MLCCQGFGVHIVSMHPEKRLLETWCLDETECRSSHSSVEIQKIEQV